MLLLGACWTPFPHSSKVRGWVSSSARSLLDFKPGPPQRAPPPALSPPLPVAFNTPAPPFRPISQLRGGSQSPCPFQRVPSPSWRPHSPPPQGPPSRGSSRAVVLEVMSLSHEAAARTCSSFTPSPGSRGPRVGSTGALGPGSAFLPLRQVTVRRIACQVPYLSGGGQVKLLRALCNWETRLRGFPH